MLKLRSLGAILTLIITIAMPNVGWGACGGWNQGNAYTPAGFWTGDFATLVPTYIYSYAGSFCTAGVPSNLVVSNNWVGWSCPDGSSCGVGTPPPLACGATAGACSAGATPSSVTTDATTGVSSWTCTGNVNGQSQTKQCRYSKQSFSAQDASSGSINLQNTQGSAQITKTGGVTAQDDISTSGNVTATGNVSTTSGNVSTASGNVSTTSGNVSTASGNVSTTSGYVQVGSQSSLTDTSCSQAGAIKFDTSTSKFVGCNGSTWKGLGGGGGLYIVKGGLTASCNSGDKALFCFSSAGATGIKNVCATKGEGTQTCTKWTNTLADCCCLTAICQPQ